MSTQGFDRFAESYDDDLQQALATSGEDKNYFAKGRVNWVTAKLKLESFNPNSVLDYGCGTGTAAPFLAAAGLTTYVGVDLSAKSVEFAKRHYSEEAYRFYTLGEYEPCQSLDLAYTNGVFHHIPIGERFRAATYVWQSLRPGGYFAFWENNPWNPGTRYVMSNCAFDHDAITLTPPESRRLLKSAGFEIVSSSFLFIFPKVLSSLRFLEAPLSRLPFGGQYLVLCQKPAQ